MSAPAPEPPETCTVTPRMMTRAASSSPATRPTWTPPWLAHRNWPA